MMNCQQYIFHITSGQAQEARVVDRFWAAQHRLICPYCRAFAQNDRQLSALLKGYRENILSPDQV